MSVDQDGVIDVVSVDKDGTVILTISDHLEWTESIAHQEILEDKLNRYLAFIESGELEHTYPKAQGKPIRIEVVFVHAPDSSGENFLSRAQSVIADAGFGFNFRLLNKAQN